MKEVDTQIQDLVDAAIQAAQHAYVPYSKYHVGAALLTSDGEIYTGCNVENSSYPACICGERTALVKAVSTGERNFDAIVVATSNGGTPCGICRQMLFEFSPDLRVITVNFEGVIHHDIRLSELLKHGFGPDALPPPTGN